MVGSAFKASDQSASLEMEVDIVGMEWNGIGWKWKEMVLGMAHTSAQGK